MPLASPHVPSRGHGGHDMNELCASDPWSGNLDTGLLRVGTTTRQILQLDGPRDCGLLTLIQCFDPADRRRLIEQFERAATEPTRFSFSTRVACGSRSGQPIFCVGRSYGHNGYEPSELSGIFIFPHL